MNSHTYKGSFLAILSGFLYGFVGYFGVSAIEKSHSVVNMLFWRFFISSLLIGGYLVLKKKPQTLPFKEIKNAFINGAIYYAISTTLYFFACPYIGSGLAMVIFFTYPVMIILLNYALYKQVIPPSYFLSIVIILVGMALFVDKQDMEFSFIGIILAMISAFFYAAYLIASNRIKRLSTHVSTLMICLGCASFFFIAALLHKTLFIPKSPTVWLHLFGISIISTVIPILLLLESLKYIDTTKASILSVLEPVFVLVFGIVLLGETVKMHYLIGAAIVLGGALITLTTQQSVKKTAIVIDKTILQEPQS